MGRFLNSQKHGENTPVVVSQPLANDRVATPAPAFAAREESPTLMHWLGFWALSMYLLSGFFNEFVVRTSGFSPRLAAIATGAMFGAFVLLGALVRSTDSKIAKLWWGLLLWMAICIPFSTYRRGSLTLLLTYGSRNHFLLFFLSAFLINLKQCRLFMFVTALSSFSLLLWCYAYGAMDPESSRFTIPESLFYGNANDLGIQLVISMGSFLYLIMQDSLPLRLAGLIGFPATFFYLLKTGSRGAALACVVFFAATFLYSRGISKLLLIVGLSISLAAATFVIPSSTLSRLVMVFLDPKEEARSEEVHAVMESHAIASQVVRWELFKLSLWYTLTNPVFGVGPGEFVDRVAGDDARESRRSGWIGTHNSYTQVSSECGLPGAFFYIAVLWLTLRTARRLLAQSRDHPELAGVRQLAFTLLVSAVAFAVSALFHHIAYTSHLALLAGQAIAYDRAAQPLLERARRSHG